MAVGVSTSIISEWEKGKKKPSRENLAAVADYFHVTADYLLNGSEMPITERARTAAEESLLRAFRRMREPEQEALLTLLAGRRPTDDN